MTIPSLGVESYEARTDWYLEAVDHNNLPLGVSLEDLRNGIKNFNAHMRKDSNVDNDVELYLVHNGLLSDLISPTLSTKNRKLESKAVRLRELYI